MFGPPKGLGQQSIYKEPPNQYSKKSRRAKGYPSEESLIATGQIQDTDHPLSVDNYYGVMSAPPIPYIDDEHPRILAEQNRVLWPHEDSYNLALGELSQGSLVDKALKAVTPDNAVAWVVSGALLLFLGQTKLKGNWASGIVTGGGGIILGMGLIPLAMGALSKKPAATPAKKEKK